MIAKFTFDYATKLTAEQRDALNQIVDQPLETKGEPDETGRFEIEGFRTYEAELEAVLAIIGNTARVNVAGIGDPRPLLDIRDSLIERIDRLDAAVRTFTPPEGYVNPRVDVHVPGLGLLQMNDVMLHNDGCTDELQTYLNEGWRILAICPQPDQRRPDYILGRATPEQS